VTMSFEDAPIDRIISDDSYYDDYISDHIKIKDLHKGTPTCTYLKKDCILLKVCKM